MTSYSVHEVPRPLSLEYQTTLLSIPALTATSTVVPEFINPTKVAFAPATVLEITVSLLNPPT